MRRGIMAVIRNIIVASVGRRVRANGWLPRSGFSEPWPLVWFVSSLACHSCFCGHGQLWAAERRSPGPAAGSASARHGTGRGTHDGHDGGSRAGTQDLPAVPRREASRPSTAPAYYLGRPAALWISAMRPRRILTTASHRMEAVTLADDNRHPGPAARRPTADASGKVPLTLA